jgi:TPR repeat protein
MVFRLLCCLIIFALFEHSTPALAEKRVALVVGNSAYQNVARLDNPTNDASLMAATLKDLGFTLVGDSAQLNLEKAALDLAVQRFGKQLQGADVALFYYAGHGVQVRGSNYLVPVNANPTREADVDFQMMDINLVLDQMQGSGTRLNLVILDACRNNPFGGRGLRSAEGGLAQIRAPEGSLISYATQPGSVAQDGNDGHSPYTRALANTIRRSGLDIFQTFNEVGLAVKRVTGGSQQPWVSSSPIDGNFYFTSPPSGPPLIAPSVPQQVARLPDPSDSLRRDHQAECDRLAASPLDNQRPQGVVGVEPGQIDIVPALAACEAAMRDFPDVVRFTFQTGRVANQQKDFARARELYERAASKGSFASANNLGALYNEGNGVTKDYGIARSWFEKAANGGFPRAMTNLGRLYENGHGVPVDLVETRKWFQRAAAANDPVGVNALGYLYEKGAGVPKDFGQARKWYDKAAAQGSTMALVNIGNLYRDGNGVARDYTEARIFYEKAANSAEPNAIALNNIGAMYGQGQGAPKDFTEARSWYEKAAALGLPLAMSNLGFLYLNGNGVAKDVTEARQWFEKAMAAGDPGAMNALGYIYEKGLGVTADLTEARTLYEKSAALGQSTAMSNLGNLYRDGRGVQKDQVEARKWYEKSAAAGRAYAMVSLGAMYQNGLGVPINLEQARKWYEMAIAAGDESAKVALSNLNSGKR